jgi:hypothetical protein
MITLAPRASHSQSSVVQLTPGETTLVCAAGQQLVLRPIDVRSVVGASV